MRKAPSLTIGLVLRLRRNLVRLKGLRDPASKGEFADGEDDRTQRNRLQQTKRLRIICMINEKHSDGRAANYDSEDNLGDARSAEGQTARQTIGE